MKQELNPHRGSKFLHDHPIKAMSLGLDEGHVIVDRADWEEAQRLWNTRQSQSELIKPTPEDVKRWFAILTGMGEDAFYTAINEWARDQQPQSECSQEFFDGMIDILEDKPIEQANEVSEEIADFVKEINYSTGSLKKVELKTIKVNDRFSHRYIILHGLSSGTKKPIIIHLGRIVTQQKPIEPVNMVSEEKQMLAAAWLAISEKWKDDKTPIIAVDTFYSKDQILKGLEKMIKPIEQANEVSGEIDKLQPGSICILCKYHPSNCKPIEPVKEARSYIDDFFDWAITKGYSKLNVPKYVIDLLEKYLNDNLLQSQQPDGWIDVNERLPEENELIKCRIIQYVESDMIKEGRISGAQEWQPLPTPPTG